MLVVVKIVVKVLALWYLITLISASPLLQRLCIALLSRQANPLRYPQLTLCIPLSIVAAYVVDLTQRIRSGEAFMTPDTYKNAKQRH